MHFIARWWLTAPVFLLLLLAGPASARPAYAPEAVGAGPQAPAGERPSQGARIGAELGVGVLGSLALGLGGGLTGGLLGLALCSGSSGAIMSGFCPIEAALLGGAAGVGLGMPIGVYWGGRWAGGNGKFLGALGGFGAALALGGLAFSAEQNSLGAGLLLTAPFLTVAGYELTDSDPQPAPHGAAPATVAPAVGLRAGGASFGLQGTF